MSWKVPLMWEGADVWIIGGGPSITTEFGIPNEVVQSVIDKTSPPSVYSPYMSFLHDKHVIGINVAFLIGDWIDVVFFGDSNFFNSYKLPLSNFPGLKMTCSPNKDHIPWIKFLPRNPKQKRGISKDASKVSWNYNSGAAAISIAANAGAKRIILLGFDMVLDAEENQHWHDLYNKKAQRANKNHRGTGKSKPLPFDRHLRGFDAIAEDAKKRGITIINASSNSRIEQFEKISVQELIKQYKKK